MRVKLELVCDISEEADHATDVEVTEWVTLQLGLSDGLTVGNPMINQKVHLLHPDNINVLIIEKP